VIFPNRERVVSYYEWFAPSRRGTQVNPKCNIMDI